MDMWKLKKNTTEVNKNTKNSCEGTAHSMARKVDNKNNITFVKRM